MKNTRKRWRTEQQPALLVCLPSHPSVSGSVPSVPLALGRCVFLQHCMATGSRSYLPGLSPTTTESTLAPHCQVSSGVYNSMLFWYSTFLCFLSRSFCDQLKRFIGFNFSMFNAHCISVAPLPLPYRVPNGYGKIELNPVWTDEQKLQTYGNVERYFFT